jgi:hypothetical protein
MRRMTLVLVLPVLLFGAVTGTSPLTTAGAQTDTCTQLQQTKAAFNAQIDALIAAIDASNLPGAQKAGIIAQLEAIRAQGNAQFDAALAAANCNTTTTTMAATTTTTVVTPPAGADTTPPTCAVTGLFPGPPKQQEVTVQDAGGIALIFDVFIENGTVATDPVSPPPNPPLDFPFPANQVKVTATKADSSLPTRWEFKALDVAGNITHCI